MQASDRPAHLGPEYASQFSDPSAVEAYGHRAPYPPEVFEILLSLVQGQPRNVVDLGCGRGEIARALAPHVDRVDAIDPSAAMIAAGKTLPCGTHPRLHWALGRAEEAVLTAPCALAAAGNLHWMEWAQVLPRLARALAPHACLAIVETGRSPAPWDESLLALIRTFSTNSQFAPYDLASELTGRRLLSVAGRREAKPVAYERTVQEFIESIHAQNGFSRDRMDQAAADAFDREVRDLVSPYAERGRLRLTAVATVTWGRPAKRS